MMLRLPVRTRNFRTSFITVVVTPPKEVGVGRNGSVPISRNSPSINIGGPKGPNRLSSAPCLSRPYLNPNTCTQPPLFGAEGSSAPCTNMPLPSLVVNDLALIQTVLSNPLFSKATPYDSRYTTCSFASRNSHHSTVSSLVLSMLCT